MTIVNILCQRNLLDRMPKIALFQLFFHRVAEIQQPIVMIDFLERVNQV